MGYITNFSVFLRRKRSKILLMLPDRSVSDRDGKILKLPLCNLEYNSITIEKVKCR